MTQAPVTETGLVKWQVGGKLVQMDRLQAKAICKNASNDQIDAFLQYASFMGLNPWANEIYLIPFGGDSSAPTVFIGKEAYIKRAEMHPQLDFFAAGIMAINNDTNEVVYNKSEALFPGQKLYGAWCEVQRKDRSRSQIIEIELEKYARYSTSGKKNMWDNNSPMMIRKVALCHGLHESFPGLMDYRGEGVDLIVEPDIHPVGDKVVEGTIRNLPDLEDAAPLAPDVELVTSPVTGKDIGGQVTVMVEDKSVSAPPKPKDAPTKPPQDPPEKPTPSPTNHNPRPAAGQRRAQASANKMCEEHNRSWGPHPTTGEVGHPVGDGTKDENGDPAWHYQTQESMVDQLEKDFEAQG